MVSQMIVIICRVNYTADMTVNLFQRQRGIGLESYLLSRLWHYIFIFGVLYFSLLDLINQLNVHLE